MFVQTRQRGIRFYKLVSEDRVFHSVQGELLGHPHQGLDVAEQNQDAGRDEDFHLDEKFERTYQSLPSNSYCGIAHTYLSTNKMDAYLKVSLM